MKKQALTFIKHANEIEHGDRILTTRMTVAAVETVEPFKDSSGRSCVEVGIGRGAQRLSIVFLSGDAVLVLE